jgi:hypothetical protein
MTKELSDAYWNLVKIVDGMDEKEFQGYQKLIRLISAAINEAPTKGQAVQSLNQVKLDALRL